MVYKSTSGRVRGDPRNDHATGKRQAADDSRRIRAAEMPEMRRGYVLERVLQDVQGTCKEKSMDL